MAGDQTFKAVLNDTNPKAKGRSFSIEISGTGYNHFLGKSIGDTVDGMFVGEGDKTLTGYKLEITGGSDTTGRAMRPDLDGGGVKPVLVSPGVGYKGKRYVDKNGRIYRYKYDGIRRRRNLRGNVISQNTRQINLKVVDYGKRPLGVIFGLEEEGSAESSEEE
ncbi:MAG: S6e family ribosomal protein [Candidatus Thalassarchaeaceae archaeon]|jgi:small subunit ribosomal protein S6e|nr:30S ribosomal protein S6e [Euryarchaeota archaeon]NDB93289.1 30S ribosomal protein S6e [Euryarchaeota archaeon]NDF22110.1 30S ribosomal protein S6e [Euryarchaeota archaeon]NDF36425.1 30S ribosomal protein S6e [Euryarchaeota archaeon]NDG21289.1 30S ribosomal protein S6e [Euryarchaeota archaeon]